MASTPSASRRRSLGVALRVVLAGILGVWFVSCSSGGLNEPPAEVEGAPQPVAPSEVPPPEPPSSPDAPQGAPAGGSPESVALDEAPPAPVPEPAATEPVAEEPAPVDTEAPEVASDSPVDPAEREDDPAPAPAEDDGSGGGDGASAAVVAAGATAAGALSSDAAGPAGAAGGAAAEIPTDVSSAASGGQDAAREAQTTTAPTEESPPVAAEPEPEPREAGVAPVAAVVADPDARDKTSRDYGPDCARSGCHAEMRKAPFVHGPILVGACDRCHAPVPESDPAEHRFQLTETKEELCASCHEPDTPKKVAHEPFAKHECLGCHDPHGGKTNALLKVEKLGTLCESCHERDKSEHLHGPYVAGECSLCHTPHESDYEKLLALPGRDLCVRCHTEVEELIASSPFAHGPVAVNCSVCHMAHGSSNRMLLRAEGTELCENCHDTLAEKMAGDAHVHGALASEKGCAGCHTPHASQYKSQLLAVASDLCLGCHADPIVNSETGETTIGMAKVLAAPFKHGPIKEGNCQGCHYPHSSPNRDLLHEPYPLEFYKPFEFKDYALCFQCHEQTLVQDEYTTTLTGFRDGSLNLHFLHVNREKGRTCRVCHEVHASDRPKHIRESVPFGKSNWMLPLNFEKTDTGGKCAPGCHKAWAYDNTSDQPPSREGRREVAPGD